MKIKFNKEKEKEKESNAFHLKVLQKNTKPYYPEEKRE